jgi:HAMP domain-containing protein
MFAARFALAACLLVISLGVWFLLNRSASKPPGAFATATAALDLRNQIDHAIPDVEVSPLSEELERLNRDLDNATQTLLAALP